MTAQGSGCSRTVILCAELLIACAAGLLIWFGVSWAIHPHRVLLMDELGNLMRYLTETPWHFSVLLPTAIYNDRPSGFILVRILYDRFGLNYAPQLCCFLVIHFANCVLAFVLLRRLGLERALSLAAVGVFGVLSTTAQTATYLGAVFDVLGAFFVLASTLAFLSERRGGQALSAVLFFLAMRTKEFAIVLPVLLAILTAMELPLKPVGQFLRQAMRRLWMVLAVWIVFVVRYLSLVPSYHLSPQSPYYPHYDVGTVFASFAYYSSLVFGLDNTAFAKNAAIVGTALIAAAVYGILRKSTGLVFCVSAYGLILAPVSTMPGIRTPFYVYAPQVFLLGAIGFLVQDLLFRLAKDSSRRTVLAVCASLAAVGWGASFRESAYFIDRANFGVGLRAESAKSAEDAARLLPIVAPGSHVYVNSGSRNPWLFIGGPCAYYMLPIRSHDVSCVLLKPEPELRSLYADDTGPKYWLDYGEGGVLSRGDSKTY